MRQLDQSSALFFPMSEQKLNVESRDGNKILLGGVKQTAVISQEGCNIQSDPIVRVSRQKN